MSNEKLNQRQTELKQTAETLIKQYSDIEAEIQKLIASREQVKRNFDAVQGALQLAEEFLADTAGDCACEKPKQAKLELVN